MSGQTRREFLATLAAAGVAAAASSWYTERLFAMVEEGTLPAARGPGIESWVPTACRLCPAACGMRVRLVDGLPVGLEGNRTDPVTAGGLCPAGFAALQEMVHPDRLRSPMRRDGPRGSGRWTSISWDEALEQIADPLRRLRQEGRPQAFAVLERGDSALTCAWIEHVMEAYGSPNFVFDGSAETWRAAWSAVAGVDRLPAVDLANSDFILSFGHELFETDGHPVWQSKAWGRLRAPSVPRPASLVYVGPRISPTAAHADLRIAIRPGEEATLALGLVHVLMMEDMVSRTFLDRWTEGYATRSEGLMGAAGGFENFVRQNYTPEEVSRRTGAPVDEILRLGRAFGSAHRPVAMIGPAALHAEGGLAAAMSTVALNLAVGAVGRAGGYVMAGVAPLALPPHAEPDAVARRGLAAPRVDGAAPEATHSSAAKFMQNLAGGEPYPLEVLFIHSVNPAHEWPGGADFEKAIERVGLVVATAQVPDETAALADIILPETSFLEAWGLLSSAHALPLSYAVLQQPVVSPLYESRSFEDIWFALARRVGGAAASAIPAGSYGDWLPEAAAGLHRAGRGTIASGAQRERIAGFVESRGWKLEGPRSVPEFWQALRESGSWADAPSIERTPAELLGGGTARFEFWPGALIRDVRRIAGGAAGDESIYDRQVGTTSEPTPEGESRGAYPLDLLVFDTNTIWRGRTALTPLLLELTGSREDIAWDSWIEIHPTTAERHGIRDGTRLRIESPTGQVVARARITSVVSPDAVAMPRGLGHSHFGRFANGVGANAMSLIPVRVDPLTGAALLVARVRFANV
jgi:menaquinone reductase, molybdopterin-binding-like subunit